MSHGARKSDLKVTQILFKSRLEVVLKTPVSFNLEGLQGSNFWTILDDLFFVFLNTFFENIPQLKTPVSFNLEGLQGSNFWPILDYFFSEKKHFLKIYPNLKHLYLLI